MGNSCCSGEGKDGGELHLGKGSKRQSSGPIKNRKFTMEQMALLLKIQAVFRGHLARKRVRQIRAEKAHKSNYEHFHPGQGIIMEENFDN